VCVLQDLRRATAVAGAAPHLPLECTSSRAAPALDTLVAISHALLALRQ
jgi:hypothetical protein